MAQGARACERDLAVVVEKKEAPQVEETLIHCSPRRAQCGGPVVPVVPAPPVGVATVASEEESVVMGIHQVPLDCL